MQILDIIWRNYWNISRHIDQAPGGGLLGVMISWMVRVRAEGSSPLQTMVDIGERVCLLCFYACFDAAAQFNDPK